MSGYRRPLAVRSTPVQIDQICRYSGKTIYHGKGDAKQAIATLRKNGAAERRDMSVYKCPFCGWFHITKVVKSRNPEYA